MMIIIGRMIISIQVYIYVFLICGLFLICSDAVYKRNNFYFKLIIEILNMEMRMWLIEMFMSNVYEQCL